MSRSVEIQSARDGLTLTLSNFVPEDSSHLADSFLVSVQNYEIRVEARASSFMAPNLGEYFQDIAKNWRGWEGEKTWETLEGELALSATADTTGHVRLAVFLRGPQTGYEWQFRGALAVESGQLEAMATAVTAAWPA